MNTMNTWDKCKNCGGERGIHHCLTDQCPVGGREAPVGKPNKWETTTFEMEDNYIATPERQNADLLAALKLAARYLEHPDVLAITKNMAVSGNVVNERIRAAVAKAEG